jgi:GAF domain-containing protein
MSEPRTTDATARSARCEEVLGRIRLLLDDEPDWVAAMATVACELHGAFEHFHWTGFYRAVEPDTLVIGPYQGGHGCLRIAFGRGVCGMAAATRQSQLVPDVDEFPGHIACSDSTRSELVVPVLRPDGTVLAVLDVDSDEPDAFDETDRQALEELCLELGARYGGDEAG